MNNIVEQTRVKLALITMGVVIGCGLIRAFLPQFPFDGVVKWAVGVFGAYATGKTLTDLINPGGEKNG